MREAIRWARSASNDELGSQRRSISAQYFPTAYGDLIAYAKNALEKKRGATFD